MISTATPIINATAAGTYACIFVAFTPLAAFGYHIEEEEEDILMYWKKNLKKTNTHNKNKYI
jgi:hypothetical protein